MKGWALRLGLKKRLKVIQKGLIVGLLPTHEEKSEPKRGKKEVLADKPLDFEKPLFGHSCLSALTEMSCCLQLS